MSQDVIIGASRYSFKKFPFMQKPGIHMPVSEPYVSIPPALVIRDSKGDLWTLGFDRGGWRTGEFEFDVVRNGKKTGEYACRIEYRGGKVRIYGADRWRVWTGTRFV